MPRRLTGPEIQMLRPIFKNTLRYESIVIKTNEANVGGVKNSITPAGVAYISTVVYCDDFSKTYAGDQWVFVHEMVHVWQWGHHIWPVNAAIGTWLQSFGDYAKAAYGYDLVPGKEFADYNIEQQASIVADYWALLTKKLPALKNNNPKAVVSDYDVVINQLQNSGPSVRKLDEVPF